MTQKHAMAVLLTVVLAIIMVGCPLPFEFTPSDSTAGPGSVGDPANPSVTAAPVMIVSEITSGQAINAAPDTIQSPRNVRIEFSSETRGARFFYTTDGSDPIPGQPATRRFPDDGPVEYVGDGSGGTVNAIAIASSMYPSLVTTRTVSVDYVPVATPTFSPSPGNYDNDQSVTMTSTTPGATIWYRIVDGTDGAPAPVPGDGVSVAYTGPLSVAGNATAKSIAAIAVRPEMRTSPVANAVYTIGYGSVATPTFTPAPGNYDNDQIVTITSTTPGATIWYRIVDGTDGAPAPVPGDGVSVAYTGPISVAGNATAKSIAAIAVKPEMLTSPVANAVYTIVYGSQTEPPVFSLRDGLQGIGTALSITTATAGATVHYTYTDDGSLPATPVPGSPGTFAYTGPIVLTGQNTTHRFIAIAVAPAHLNSELVSSTLTTVPRIVVTTTADGYPQYSPPTTLRDALLAANSPGQTYGDAYVPPGTTVTVIEFAESLGPAFTITLDEWSGPLPVARSVVISGDPTNPGRVTISGGDTTRIFGVIGGDVTIRDVTLERGRAQAGSGIGGVPDSSGGGGGGGVGGAIYVRGATTALTIVNSILRDNSAIGGAGGAGGQINAGQFFASGSAGGGGIGADGYVSGGGSGGSATDFDTGSPGGNGGWLGGGGAGASLSSSPRVGGNGGFAGGGGGGGARRSGGDGASGGAGGAFGGGGGWGNSSGTAGGGGGAGLGGAIFVESGALTLISTELVANTAVGGHGGASYYGPPNGQPGQGRGGAVFLHTGTTAFTADSVSYVGNAVASGGGPPLPEDVYDNR